MKVSVVIPCYNAEAHLAQAIRSVLQQTHPPCEVIVVDDGSRDRSRDIAASFGGKVRILPTEHAGGCRARNHGAAQAQGDALMFLDADDVLGPTVLQSLVEILERHPTEIVACPWYRLEYVDGSWIRRPPSCRALDPGENVLSAWLTGWYHPPCSVLWSRAAYARTGGWDEQLVVNQDGDLMLRALATGITLHRTGSGAAFYRRAQSTATSVSGKRFTEAGLDSRLRVLSKAAQLLEEQGKLGRYRTEIGIGFHLVLRDSTGRYPLLRDECLALARRFAGPAWVRAGRQFGYKLRRRAERVARFCQRRSAIQHLEEVRFGLDEWPEYSAALREQ
jgi:glycosyltransferase involved in cell wall biosynthesis